MTYDDYIVESRFSLISTFGNFRWDALMIFTYKEQPIRKICSPQIIWTWKTVQQTTFNNFNGSFPEPFENGFYRCLTCRNLIVQPYKIYMDNESRKMISWKITFLYFSITAIVYVLARLTGDIKGEEILFLFFQKVSYEKHFKVWQVWSISIFDL